MLVAAGISLAVLGMTVPFLTTTMRDEPDVSGEALNIGSARTALERMIRDVRQGIEVTTSTPSQLSLRTYSRHSTCGGSGILAAGAPPVTCQVTYTCGGTTCTRIEADPGVTSGTAVEIARGLGSANVFTYTPATGPKTHVGITLVVPDPDGNGDLTLTDGVSLRNATLLN